MRFAAIAVALAYLAIVAAIYLGQRKLQYFPDNKGLTPMAVGLAGVEIVRITAEDGESILAWFAPASPGRPTILCFHGNAGEMGDRAERFAAYRAEGLGVLFLSYRGYGGSSGKPSEAGLVMDASAAYDWLAAHGLSSRDIVVVGESLGSGVAVQLAVRRKVTALALEAPFASAVDIAAQIYWWLPVGLLMKDRFDSMSQIGRIGAPLLIIHGDKDEIIPLAEGRRLFAAAKEPKEMIVTPGGTHVSIFGEDSWAREVDFFERVLVRGGSENKYPAGSLPRGQT
jgi:fermentation-respiration switch protein FrsA (DUF1100 family)